VSHSVPHTE